MADLVTKEEVQEFLNIDTLSDAQGKQVDLIIPGISVAICKFCGREFLSASYSETLNGPGRGILQLKNYPLIGIISVTYADPAGTVTVIASSDYWIIKDCSHLKLKPVAVHGTLWRQGDQNYAIVYTAGYAAVPDDIKLACLTWIAVLYQRAEHKLHAVQSITLGDQNTSYRFDKIPPEVEAMLQGYVRLPYA